ncbi:MAG TPA: LuxR C-terminal-related transcriptional regulator [Ktedonobacteraceae bacterium]
MNTSMIIQNQFLTTNFFVPVASHPLISRPRLFARLQESFRYPLTLISAPAGFGKTMLLSAWTQSLSASSPRVAWISLDARENDPGQFWTCILAALDRQQPQRFKSLLLSLQSEQVPSLNYIPMVLINLLVEGIEQFLLILDDYQVITEQKVHTSLTYLVEHLPPSLRIILATRADPPLPLSLLRTRQQMLEVRTDPLRCTTEETRAFFHEVIGADFSGETIQEVTARTEGWLVGLQLLGLSLQEHPDPALLLEEVNGNQREILDYLTEEVLRQQLKEVQTFLVSTSILERFNASLCDAVMERHGSQEMLKRLEQANLFLVSLDDKCQWYRYHKLFAEALRSRLKQMPGDLAHVLHSRASIWYAEHNALTEAILHAFSAHQWQWAADLIERLPLMSLTFEANEHTLVTLREWLEQLPANLVSSRPGLCLVSAQMWWAVASHPVLETWLNAAEATLTTQTDADVSSPMHPPQAQQNQEDLLGDIAAFRVFVRSYKQDGEAVLALSQQTLAQLPAHNYIARSLVSSAQAVAYYTGTNNIEAAIQCSLQASSLAQAAGKPALAISALGTTVLSMIGAGQLREAQQLAQQAILLGKTQSGDVLFPEVGWPALLQADILREWNDIGAALELAEEARSLCEKTTSLTSLVYLLCRCAVRLRISLSCRDLDAACTALRQFERVGSRMNRPTYLYFRSFFTTVDQVRLWLACEELDRATRWAKGLEGGEWYGTPFAHEREEVACARILLAKKQPTVALQRLESVLVRASNGQRWSHVIEMRLLQALAYQMRQQEAQALDTLSQAVHLAEPEGYIRSFVDEGPQMAALLSRLRMRQSKYGPTPYVDTILAAFPQESTENEPRQMDRVSTTCSQGSTGHEARPATVEQRTKVQPLLDPLTEREREVLEHLARGSSNQQIAHELVIAIDTVKRHVSQILAKLDVQNRVQAVRRAQDVGLLS